LEAKEYDNALVNFTKAIQEEENVLFDGLAKKDNLSHYYNNRGLVQSTLKSYEEASKDFEYAIKFDPNNADCFFNRGNLHLAQQKFELAHEDFDTAITMEISNAKYYHAKGLSYQY